MTISPLFNPDHWDSISLGFQDITYHKHKNGKVLRIAFNRPEIRNAFRPKTVDELIKAFQHAGLEKQVGVVLLTGNGPSPKDGVWAFCSGGDQRMRGPRGYMPDASGNEVQNGRLHILEVQRLIRFMPKVVIAVIPGWSCGGGHSLHVVCDLALASSKALFKQTDVDVASFDGGFGSALLARQVGQKKAREIFFLAKTYTASQALSMGMINAVCEHDRLEEEALEWAHTINAKSPTAIAMLKYAFNLPDDGMVGQQLFAGLATRLQYETPEAQEGRDSFLEKREKRFQDFDWPY